MATGARGVMIAEMPFNVPRVERNDDSLEFTFAVATLVLL